MKKEGFYPKTGLALMLVPAALTIPQLYLLQSRNLWILALGVFLLGIFAVLAGLGGAQTQLNRRPAVRLISGLYMVSFWLGCWAADGTLHFFVDEPNTIGIWFPCAIIAIFFGFFVAAMADWGYRHSPHAPDELKPKEEAI